MASYLFSPEYRQETFKNKINDKQRFDLFLEALELTEQGRHDELVTVRNLQFVALGDLTKPFSIAHHLKNETKDKIISTETYSIHPSCIGQLCGLDKNNIPTGWFKSSLKERITPLHPEGELLDETLEIPHVLPKIDLRQHILQAAVWSRPRKKSLLRTEKPWYYGGTTNEDGVISLNYAKPPQRLVMGILGENYPKQWSTFGFFNAIKEQVHDAFGDYTYDVPYVTQSGTFRMAFHTKDPEWRIEPRKGDTIGFGGVIRDNPYGRASLSWKPFTLRLACINGMTFRDHMNSLVLDHRNWASMIREFVKGVLRPRLDPVTLEPLNQFEGKLRDPLPESTYIEEPELLYEHLAKVMIARLLAQAHLFKLRYTKAADLFLNDYNAALDRVCTDYELGEKIREKLHEVALKDVTIPNPTDKEFTVYDLSNIFSSYANSYSSDEQREKYSSISGDIIMKEKYPLILSMVKAK